MSDRTERHPAGYPSRQRFPAAEPLTASEGGSVYATAAEGGYWLISDESPMADLVNERDADSLVTLHYFSDQQAWIQRVTETRGAE